MHHALAQILGVVMAWLTVLTAAEPVTLSLPGTATVEVLPDRAIISLAVHGAGDDRAIALSRFSQRRATLVTAVRAFAASATGCATSAIQIRDGQMTTDAHRWWGYDDEPAQPLFEGTWTVTMRPTGSGTMSGLVRDVVSLPGVLPETVIDNHCRLTLNAGAAERDTVLSTLTATFAKLESLVANRAVITLENGSIRGSNHWWYGNKHQVQEELSIAITQPQLVTPLLERVAELSGVRISGVQYSVVDMRPHRDQARRMAVAAAKAKAELYRQEFALKGSLHVVRISEEKNVQDQQQPMWFYAGGHTQQNRFMSQNMYSTVGATPNTSLQVEPQRISVLIDVQFAVWD